MALNFKKIWNGLKLVAKAASTADSKGDLEVIDGTGKLQYHNGTSVSPVVTEAHSATLTNKTFDANGTGNTLSNVEVADLAAGVLNTSTSMTGATDSQVPSALAIKTYVDNGLAGQNQAIEITYDNTTSGLAATNVQAAIDEVVVDIGNVSGDLGAHILDTVDAHDASAISNVPAGSIASTDVQAALNELDGDIQGHITDTTDAHDASAISVVPTGNLAATDVQAGLQELQGDIDTLNSAGYVVGPASATDEAIARFDLTTGKLIQNSSVTITDAGVMSGATQLNVDNLRLDGNDLSSTDTNGNLNLIPNGTGEVDVQKDLRVRQDIHFDISTDNATGANVTLTVPSTKIIRLTNASLTSIDMIPAGSQGQEITLINATGANITINDNTGATAANRILTGTKAALTLKDEASIPLVYDSTESRWMVAAGVGSGGISDLDVLFQDDFESSVLGDYTQTGLSLSTSSPLDGLKSALLTHDSVSNQSFKRIYSVAEKFRNKNMTIELDIKSTATQGNVTILVYDETNAATILASTALTLSSANGGTQTSVAFDMPSTCASFSYTITALPEAGSPTTRIDDIKCYITGVAEYSAVVQENDSMIRLDTANGHGSTATKIRRFSNLTQNIGSDILYQDSATNGASFTILTDGVYSISYTDLFNASANLGISKNASSLTTDVFSLSVSERLGLSITSGTDHSECVSWTGYLLAGDIIRPHTAGTAASSAPARTTFTISKQGSLKVANVASNQKLPIPSSELRFEGASARGGTDTAIVKFDTMAKLRGDAFTVTNTAAEGTYITMLKAGKIDITASLNLSVGITLQITKNQVTKTALSTTASEIMAVEIQSSSPGTGGVSWSGSAAIGDVFRIASNGTPNSSNFNSLNIYFQEQEVQVSVSNTLPTFSESDSSVRVDTANGYGSTATKIRRFSNVRQNIGTDITYTDSATNGSSFTVNEAGIYSVSYTDYTNISVVGLTLNSAQLSTNIGTVVTTTPSEVLAVSSENSDSLKNVSWTGYLSVGDVIRPHSNGVAATDNDGCLFTISKVGKPNVTGVDVTPFVNIPQPSFQSSAISQTATFGVATITGALTTTNGSGIYSYNSSTGIYTALKACKVWLSNSLISGGAASVQAEVRVDNTQVSFDYSTANNGATACAVYVGQLSAGQTFQFNNGVNSTNGQRISVMAEAVDESIVTATETFSTDTATLTYAGSGTYTLSTLANAPVGTFITFTYAAGTNTRTQTTTAPTQSTSDMNANGIQLFTRAYNATSTAGNPSAIAIQIGKGMKGVSLNLYKSTVKTTAGSLDSMILSAANTERGISYKDYNESTGILIIDSGRNFLTTTTAYEFNFSDVSVATSGYITINASKNPALTGVGSNIIAARMVNTAGTSISSSATKVTFDTSLSISSGVTVDDVNDRAYAPQTGIYEVSAALQFASALYAAGNILTIQVYKNGTYYSTLASKTVDGTPTAKQGLQGSDQIRLAKGDYIEFYATNGRGATALSTTAGECWMNIKKLGGLS